MLGWANSCPGCQKRGERGSADGNVRRSRVGLRAEIGRASRTGPPWQGVSWRSCRPRSSYLVPRPEPAGAAAAFVSSTGWLFTCARRVRLDFTQTRAPRLNDEPSCTSHGAAGLCCLNFNGGAAPDGERRPSPPGHWWQERDFRPAPAPCLCPRRRVGIKRCPASGCIHSSEIQRVLKRASGNRLACSLEGRWGAASVPSRSPQ